jgi:CDP-glycerol glycerophosphotransferase
MFDFAVTGKPEFFYTYDMDRYRDELRGFYFDLSVDPPGPLSTTTEALVADIRRLPDVRVQYKQAYARFKDEFCPLEDGHATDRFLGRFFDVRPSSGERPPPPER